MAMTLRAVMEELDRLDGLEVDEVGRTELVQALARAALMGARGNSGVILSQIVRGAAEELASRPGELVDPVLVAAAFASRRRRRLRLGARAGRGDDADRLPRDGPLARPPARPPRGRQAAARPRRLRRAAGRDPRRGAGAGDRGRRAGGRAHPRAARGAARIRRRRRRRPRPGPDPGRGRRRPARRRRRSCPRSPTTRRRGCSRPHHEDSRYRYCTNFIVSGSGLDNREFLPRLEGLGDSVLVVGDEATLKVHVHTDEPESAVALFDGAGEVTNLDVADMREQMAERDARLGAPGAPGSSRSPPGEGMRAPLRRARRRRRPRRRDAQPLDLRAAGRDPRRRRPRRCWCCPAPRT